MGKRDNGEKTIKDGHEEWEGEEEEDKIKQRK